jgi:hypothetical protein
MMMKILGTSKDEYKLHLLRIEKNIQLLYDIASVTVFYSLIILKSATKLEKVRGWYTPTYLSFI